MSKNERLTLEDAIKHCEEKAARECGKCGDDHKQLAEWLREYAELTKKEKQKKTFVCISCQELFDIYSDSADTVEFCAFCGDDSPFELLN